MPEYAGRREYRTAIFTSRPAHRRRHVLEPRRPGAARKALGSRHDWPPPFRCELLIINHHPASADDGQTRPPLAQSSDPSLARLVSSDKATRGGDLQHALVRGGIPKDEDPRLSALAA